MDGVVKLLGVFFFVAFVVFTILLLYAAARAGDRWMISRGEEPTEGEGEEP